MGELKAAAQGFLPRTQATVSEWVWQLQEECLRLGKEKLVVLLKKEEIELFGSNVGEVMKRFRAAGLLVELENICQTKRQRRRQRKPSYAIKQPKAYRVQGSGDLVEVDTLSDEVRYQFNAMDVVVMPRKPIRGRPAL